MDKFVKGMLYVITMVILMLIALAIISGLLWIVVAILNSVGDMWLYRG